MTQFNVKSAAKSVSELVEGSVKGSPVADATLGGYRTPRVFAIGRAEDLMRSSSSGNVKDSGNWYTYP
jgi:hypothetical protein